MNRMKIGAVLSAVVCFGALLVPAASGQEADTNAPCSAPEYSQFDFWVGDWKVVSPDGKEQGSNHIVKILGGCVIQENWTGVRGLTGQSYNVYAKTRGVWHQSWVDSNGSLLLLDGGIEDGRMVLRGETPSKDGQGTVLHEISWQPMDTGQVVQTWRMSKDGGGEWQEAFVGVYTRRGD